VYAAASLKDALTSLAPACELRSGATLVHNFGPSNDLARQIIAANKADVFFSADEGWMDQVGAAGLLDPASRKALLSNRLVVVVPADSPLVVTRALDLSAEGIRHLSLANPEAVPAGRYAKAWLTQAGVWESVRDRVVPAPDVRAALAAVEAGAIEAGIVYQTDAAMSKRVRVAHVVPEAEGPHIVYPLAVLRDRPHVDVARRVADCYAGPEGSNSFERYGFIVLGASDHSPTAPPAPPPR
jgi:molybdate transport system substrate-binding protein